MRVCLIVLGVMEVARRQGQWGGGVGGCEMRGAGAWSERCASLLRYQQDKACAGNKKRNASVTAEDKSEEELNLEVSKRGVVRGGGWQ